MQNFKPVTVSVLFLALSCQRFCLFFCFVLFVCFKICFICFLFNFNFIETHTIESRCYRSGTYTVCRRVRAFFSPEILQAVAVKGLILSSVLILADLNFWFDKSV